jgi:predicted regulator of Ras-like GTPase activity (Roadblock/LC7/MglB family)
MKPRDMVIQEEDATRITQILTRFLGDSGAGEALLIDRGGQLLAMDGVSRPLDTVSISALTAAAFSSTAAMAQLLGETEFTMLFHEGAKWSIHVSTVDKEAILLAIFDERTTVGMVRVFAKEASRAVGAVLGEARARPRPAGEFAAPLNAAESGPAWTPPY